MFYGKDSIEERVELLHQVVSGVINIPAPSYAMGARWSDELRIKQGYTKLEDGSWATVIDTQEYLSKMKQDMIELYDNYQDSLRINGLLTRKNREMEYGLRVAEKALNNSLAITKEINDGV
jgi:hypothetical protein